MKKLLFVTFLSFGGCKEAVTPAPIAQGKCFPMAYRGKIVSDQYCQFNFYWWHCTAAAVTADSGDSCVRDREVSSEEEKTSKGAVKLPTP